MCMPNWCLTWIVHFLLLVIFFLLPFVFDCSFNGTQYNPSQWHKVKATDPIASLCMFLPLTWLSCIASHRHHHQHQHHWLNITSVYSSFPFSLYWFSKLSCCLYCLPCKSTLDSPYLKLSLFFQRFDSMFSMFAMALLQFPFSTSNSLALYFLLSATYSLLLGELIRSLIPSFVWSFILSPWWSSSFQCLSFTFSFLFYNAFPKCSTTKIPLTMSWSKLIIPIVTASFLLFCSSFLLLLHDDLLLDSILWSNFIEYFWFSVTTFSLSC